jgi:hypothetical protein
VALRHIGVYLYGAILSVITAIVTSNTVMVTVRVFSLETALNLKNATPRLGFSFFSPSESKNSLYKMHKKHPLLRQKLW